MDRLQGSLFAVGSAFAFGITIVIGRALAKAGLDAPTVLGIRFSLAGVVLVGLLAARRTSILPRPGERLAALLLGAIGYGLESSLFFMGLQRGTAAAVTLLFYAYPTLVTLFEVATGASRWRPRQLLTLGLSGTGILLIVATGTSLAISTTGVLCALGAATAFATYLVVAHRFVHRSDAMPVAAWTALGAGASFLLRGASFEGFSSPAGHWPQLIGNGFATAAAFSLMFAALHRLGPSRAAIVFTLEAFFTVVLGAALLGEGVTPWQAFGGVAVLSAAALTARDAGAVAPSPAGPAGP